MTQFGVLEYLQPKIWMKVSGTQDVQKSPCVYGGGGERDREREREREGRTC